MRRESDVSVVIATFNRAQSLARTLGGLACMHRGDLQVEVVLADNNSSDATRLVCDSFASQLPIRYLFEPRAGKSFALNRAIHDGGLGRLVAFMDDDIDPRHDWLSAIVSISTRWPQYSVFGGRIEPMWPHNETPAWARGLKAHTFGLGTHHIADADCPYPAGTYPVGNHFWLRREVLATGRRFSEHRCPAGETYVMGEDTLFLRQLVEDGFPILYSPEAVVQHRLQPRLATASGIRRRAYSNGQHDPHVWGLPRRDLLALHPIYWRLWRCAALAWAVGRYLRALVSLSGGRRVQRCLEPLSDIAYNLESLKLANARRGTP